MAAPDSNISSNINLLSQAAEASSTQVKTNLESRWGRLYSWWQYQKGEVPDWVKHHIKITKQLENAVAHLDAQGKAIPPDIVKALEHSRHYVNETAKIIDAKAFLELIRPPEAQIDKHRLLRGGATPIKDPQFEWHLNLGLLMGVYKTTEDPQLKKQISFLALNYLAKAAPISIKDIDPEAAELEEMFDLGFFSEPMIYHREHTTFESFMSEKLSSIFAKASVGPFFLTDNIEFEHLFPLSFSPIHEGSEINDMSQALLQHFNQYGDTGYNHYMKLPLLFDFSNKLDQLIQTNGDEGKEAAFKAELEKLESALEILINQTIENLKLQKPGLFKNEEDEQKMRVFIKANISCICRSQVESIGVLKALPFFADIKHFELPSDVSSFLGRKKIQRSLDRLIIGDKFGKEDSYFRSFANQTGLRIGGVSARAKIFDFIDIESLIKKQGLGHQLVEYAVPASRDRPAFQKKSEITETVLFKRFETRLASEELAREHPSAVILGKATLQLLNGLLTNEITPEVWERLNNNPQTCAIIQTSLYRLMQHLANAENNLTNFTKFTQAIELAHYEIATLLTLASPFKAADFESIYKQQLTVIPDRLKGSNIRAGLAKSAMNVFAGINAALGKKSPEKAYGEGSYFEQIAFIGDNRTTKNMVENNDIRAIDLFVGEFNHNINIHGDHTTYTPTNIIEEVETLLKAKPDTQHLTVAVDCTIDFNDSPKVKELLNRFSKEIQDGKLNFVFFRSGQKFDMLGMDNYYGAPFFMVNNGAKQWEGFSQLLTAPAYQTDPISLQWFSLVNKYAPESLDAYRKMIFDNTKAILAQVPEALKPKSDENQRVRISTVEGGMEASFIDIKIRGNNPTKIKDILEKELYKRFAERGSKIHSRGSFGFYHPNINVIADPTDNKPRNLRINPGLNPEDNEIIIEFLRDIPELLEGI